MSTQLDRVTFAPNLKKVTGEFLHRIEPPTLGDFPIWVVKIISSNAIPGKRNLAGAEPGNQIQVLISYALESTYQIKTGKICECEIERVALQKWRIKTISTSK